MSFNIEEGRTFDTLETAEKAVQAEAKRAGFSLARRSSNLKGADKTRARFVKLICTKGEHYTSHQEADNTSKKRKRQSMKKGCRFSLRIVDISGSWTVKKIINQHNHDMVETKDIYTLPDHRKLTSEQENAVAFSLGANSDTLTLLHTINNILKFKTGNLGLVAIFASFLRTPAIRLEIAYLALALMLIIGSVTHTEMG
ncbi:hypothetical protein K501DRAFT_335622 [Backusella circina FSU 941]|nr:hypothetical protein K501DRAFT_335622 [Backusella circina FSU 941]